jgi:RNA polymerase sigma factor (sigma-70 family)
MLSGKERHNSLLRKLGYNHHRVFFLNQVRAHGVDWDSIQALVERVQDLRAIAPEGDEELERTCNRLASELRPLIHQMVRRCVRDRELQEDITQEVMLLIHLKLSKYNRSRARFRAWVSRIVVRSIYRQLAREQIRRDIPETDFYDLRNNEEGEAFLETVANPEPSPLEKVIVKEGMELIVACARATLSADEFLVWSEYLLNASPHAEIAALLGYQEDRVRQMLHRARERVAAAVILDERIFSVEDIEDAIEYCQKSVNPLNELERRLLRQAIATNPRRAPGWRQRNTFRQACLKVWPFLTRGQFPI